MFLLSGVAVHSYPAKVVNFPIKMPVCTENLVSLSGRANRVC
jgi:hypothetical protein